MFVCTICSENFYVANDVIAHLHNSHNVGKQTSKFTCQFQKCVSSFLSYKTFKAHLKTHNKEINLRLSVAVSLQSAALESNELDLSNIDIDSFDASDQVEALESSFEEPVSKCVKLDPELTSALQFKAATAFSKFYAVPTVTRKIIQQKMNMIDEIANCEEMAEYEQSIFDMLKRKLNVHELERVNNFVKISKSPLQGIFSTDYQRMKYYLEQDSLVPFNANHIAYSNRRNRIGLEESKSIKCYTFDLPHLFRKYLELPNVFETVKNCLNNSALSEDLISSFLQGNIWQKKIANFKNEIVIPLSLFIDDFEPNNVLGSKSKIHKTGGVYLSIAALPTELQTMLDNIFVAGIHFAKDRKEFGLKLVMAPIVAELEKLLDGIEISVDGKTYFVRFLLAYIHGDNLGLNEILGFTTSFNANYNCRFCKADKSSWQKLGTEDAKFLRNKINYQEDVQIQDVSQTGIIDDCFLHNTKLNFHATENYIVDAMHDWLEGICKYDTAAILNNLIYSKEMFSLEVLNRRMAYFSYGHLDTKHKPIPFEKDKLKKGAIKMSAAEMLCFIRYAPLIIGNIVTPKTKSWKLLILLRNILFIILAPEFPIGREDYLDYLICKHNALYMEISQKTLPPKFHLATHYSRVIRESGPVVHYWCMRKEAKHKTSKEYCKVSCNRKDLLYSIAWKHQMILNERLINNRGFDLNKLSLSMKSFNLTSTIMSDFLLGSDIQETYKIFHFATVNGIEYKPHCNCLIDLDDWDYPIFSKICYILSNTADVLLLVQLYTTLSYSKHFDSYIVTPTKNMQVIDVSKLQWKVPLIDVTIDGRKYISLRYAI
jgi:hypothetical protein